MMAINSYYCRRMFIFTIIRKRHPQWQPFELGILECLALYAHKRNNIRNSVPYFSVVGYCRDYCFSQKRVTWSLSLTLIIHWYIYIYIYIYMNKYNILKYGYLTIRKLIRISHMDTSPPSRIEALVPSFLTGIT
jgi:hypothetical protein